MIDLSRPVHNLGQLTVKVVLEPEAWIFSSNGQQYHIGQFHLVVDHPLHQPYLDLGEGFIATNLRREHHFNALTRRRPRRHSSSDQTNVNPDHTGRSTKVLHQNSSHSKSMESPGPRVERRCLTAYDRFVDETTR